MKPKQCWMPPLTIMLLLLLGAWFWRATGMGRAPPHGKPPSQWVRELIAAQYGYAHDPRAPHGVPAEILHVGWASLWDLHGRLEALLTVHRRMGPIVDEGDQVFVDVFAFAAGGVERLFHRAAPVLGHAWTIDFIALPEPHLWIAVQRGRGTWLDMDLLAWKPESRQWETVFSAADVPDASVSRHAHGVQYTSRGVAYQVVRRRGAFEAIPTVSRPLPWTTGHGRTAHVLDAGAAEWNGRSLSFEERGGLDGRPERVSEVLQVRAGDVIHVWADPRRASRAAVPELGESRPARFLLTGRANWLFAGMPFIRASHPGPFEIRHGLDGEPRVYRFECSDRAAVFEPAP